MVAVKWLLLGERERGRDLDQWSKSPVTMTDCADVEGL